MVDRLWTIEDVAEYLSVTRYHVYKEKENWRRNFGVEYLRNGGKVGGQIRFVPEQIKKMAVKMWKAN